MNQVEINDRILANVLELLPDKKGSKSHLAKSVGFSKVHISYLLNGHRRFTMPMIAALVTHFKVDVSRLFEGKKN